MPQLPKCARKGCKNRVSRPSHKYCSPLCGQVASRNDALAASTRRIAGQESKEDILGRENVVLRNDLKKATKHIEKLEQAASVDDRILNEIVHYIEANPYKPTFAKPTAKAPSSHDHEMLALVSDAHYPEVVDPEAALGLKYNADICRRRLEYLRDTILRYRELRSSAYPVRKLTLGVIGDMLSGNIHEELEVSNERPMSEALVEMGQMLADIGFSCASEFPEVEMIVMPGNHPRITKQPRFKNKWDNWEFVLGHYVRALANSKFIVRVPKDLVYRHKIFNYTVGLTHGDGVKAQSFAGIPFYALEKRQTKLQALLKYVKQSQLDLLAYGHFHTLLYYELQGCAVIINGSVKGGDEYSIGTLYAANDPVQALLTFHPKHGITDLSRINLGAIQ